MKNQISVSKLISLSRILLPSTFGLDAFSAALAKPFFLCSSCALTMSPSLLDREFLQSIVPAPVSSRSCYTSAGDIVAAIQKGRNRHLTIRNLMKKFKDW